LWHKRFNTIFKISNKFSESKEKPHFFLSLTVCNWEKCLHTVYSKPAPAQVLHAKYQFSVKISDGSLSCPFVRAPLSKSHYIPPPIGMGHASLMPYPSCTCMCERVSSLTCGKSVHDLFSVYCFWFLIPLMYKVDANIYNHVIAKLSSVAGQTIHHIVQLLESRKWREN
jgi:hypothetical protein